MKKTILPIIIIVVIIIIITITAIIFNLRKETNSQGENTIVETSNEINIMPISEEKQDFSENNTKKNTEKNYIEMTQLNYKQYSEGKYTFRIQDATRKDGKVTIKGRVYELINFPDKLTKEQLDAVNNNQALNILGEKVVKLPNDNANEYGYDMTLIVESTIKSKYPMIYYIKKNEDGSAKLVNGSEAKIADGTDIYMQITLNENIVCKYGNKNATLSKIYEKNYHIEDENRIRISHDDYSYFNFAKGYCYSIEYGSN